MEYRRHFESLNDGDEYQRALCGMALWSEQNSRSLAGGLVSAFVSFQNQSDTEIG